MRGIALVALLSLATGPGWARPDSGSGLFSFDPSDVLEYVDSTMGDVRVHYSILGPNQTVLADLDGSGRPDFAEEVAETAEAVLDQVVASGFRMPLRESEMGLGPLGGSDAFDIYLVDFGGNADGHYASDACTSAPPNHCSGHLVMENDFAGYGYPSLSEAIAVLTSHEMFHAVQAAYEDGQPTWMSEGTAVWFTREFDPEVDDFRYFANRYLSDVGRSLDRPPTSPVPGFAYGTALWWEFMDQRLGAHSLVALQEAIEWDGAQPDPVDAILEVLAEAETCIEEEWTTFVRWNLATGFRAGLAESYPFASSLLGIEPEATGRKLDETERFYPLAATYFRVNWQGGGMAFATDLDATGLHFSLHPVEDGALDGRVEDPIWSHVGGPAERVPVAEDLTEGGYWLTVTQPQPAESSIRLTVCLGSDQTLDTCLPAEPEEEPPPADCACNSARRPGGIRAPLAALLMLLPPLLGRRRPTAR
jgi:hypothetical protein